MMLASGKSTHTQRQSSFTCCYLYIVCGHHDLRTRLWELVMSESTRVPTTIPNFAGFSLVSRPRTSLVEAM
jgi:hypothetical protein